MSRWLVLDLPDFRFERLGSAQALRPAVLVDKRCGVWTVIAATVAARRAGARLGLSLEHLEGVSVARIPVDLNGEARDLERLGRALQRGLPSIATLPPTGLVAELDGVAPDQEGDLLAQVCAELRKLGHRARGVIADDPSTALMLAVWGKESQRVEPGDRARAEALASLPVQALGVLSTAAVDELRGLGVRTVGAFVALPEAAVSVRWGAPATAAHAMARAGGGSARPHRRRELLDWATVGEPLFASDALGSAPTRGSIPREVPDNLIRVDFTRGRGR